MGMQAVCSLVDPMRKMMKKQMQYMPLWIKEWTRDGKKEGQKMAVIVNTLCAVVVLS